MGPRAEQGVLEPTSIVSEKTPLLGDAPVAVLIPLPSLEPADKLSQKELYEFVNDPFWWRLRTAFFFGYWIIFFALMVSSLTLAFNNCKPYETHIPCPSTSTPGFFSTASHILPFPTALAPKPA